jgi:alanyl-tRNA synthetase
MLLSSLRCRAAPSGAAPPISLEADLGAQGQGDHVVAGAEKDLVEKGFKSGDAIKAMAAELGGKGGGKPDMAQAGGTDPSKLPQVFEKLLAHVKGA